MSTVLASNRAESFRRFAPIALIAISLVLVAALALISGSHAADAANPGDFGLTEGDRITTYAANGNPDIFIINESQFGGFKRNFPNPIVCRFYGHLSGDGCFGNRKEVTQAVSDAFPLSCYYRNGETNAQQVYFYESTGPDNGVLHPVNVSAAEAKAADPHFFQKIFLINNLEENFYQKASPITSMANMPACSTGEMTPSATPTQSGPLTVSLSPSTPAATTVTTNAQGVEFLKVRLTGTATVTQMTLDRVGAGATSDFDNVYIYEGAKRLVAGKSFNTNGTVTFSALNIDVAGTKDLTFVADLSATAGNVNAFKLSSVMTSGTGSVGGTPVMGNNISVSGAASGTVTVTKTGSIGNPNAGAANVQVSEFKIAANTEAGSVKRIQMIQGGTVAPANLDNLVLKTGSSQWNGSIDGSGNIVFDLGSGYTIAKGGNAIFKVYADVNGKKDETVILYFEYSADVQAIGQQYGFGMAAGITDMDTTGEAHTVTLQGGALTISFTGPTAQNIGTTGDDTTFLRFSMSAASDIEIRKTRLLISTDIDGNGTWDNWSSGSSTSISDVDDIKIWDEDSNTITHGPVDGDSFTTTNSTGNPGGTGAASYTYTDTLNLSAGQTFHGKVTADVKTSNSRTGSDLYAGSKVTISLQDYSDNAPSVTELKYANTNTALATTDIVPNANVHGATMTITASGLTLSLASTPSDKTVVKGSQDVDTVGIVFAASNTSALKVTNVTLSGYSDADGTGTFSLGSAGDIASMIQNVELVEGETNTVLATAPSTNNLAAAAGTLVYNNLNWNIPAGESRTLLVRSDLLNLSAPTKAYFGFDITSTTDVTAVDNNNDSINAGNASPNGGASTNVAVLYSNGGSMTLSTSPDSPSKGAIYWGQTGASVSKFRLTTTNEAFFIEKFTVAASASGEATDAVNNVKQVSVTYTTKAGSTVTSTQAFGTGASVNFGFTGDTRPYVPKDSSTDITVKANMKTKAEGATQEGANGVFFSLDLVDKFNGSHADGFRAVGEGSSTVLDGSSSNIDDVLGANNQYVYRVFPRIVQINESGTEGQSIAAGEPLGEREVLRFRTYAMGLADSKLYFDGNTAAGSGSFTFEVVASGGTNANLTSTFIDLADGSTTDSATITSPQDGSTTGGYSSATYDFTNEDIEIAGGQSRDFSVRVNFQNFNDASDYFQLALRDDENSLIDWVGNSTGSSGDEDTASTAGVLRSLPMFGPFFTKS